MNKNNQVTGCVTQPFNNVDQINDLVNSHAGYAAKFAKNSKLPSHDALSVCLDALWIAAKNYNPEQGNFLPFARSIMRLRLADLSRKIFQTKKSSMIVFEPELEEPYIPMHDENSEIQHRVSAAIDQLPARQGFYIRKVYLEGYTHQEIADQFKVSRQASSTMIRRALINLKSALDTKIAHN